MISEEEPDDLRWRDKWLAFRVGLLIPMVELWMRNTSFRRCQTGLERWARRLPPYNQIIGSLQDAQRIAELVALGNKRYSLYPADCLTKSLVLQYVITRLGGETDLCLGVRNFTGQFEAHAWIELNGTPLNEPEAVTEIYTRFNWTEATKSRTGS